MKLDGIETGAYRAGLGSFKDEVHNCKVDQNYAKVLNASQQLSDSFKKSDEEGNTIKSPLATVASVAGVVLSTFLLGKNVGKLGVKLAEKLPANTKQKVVDTAKTVVDTLNKKIASIKNTNISEKLSSALSSTVEYVAKNPAKVATNAAGAVAVAAVAPDIIKADGNGDGIADIAQKNVNAYSTVLKNAELFTEIASAVM